MLNKIIDYSYITPKKINKYGGKCGEKVHLYRCIVSKKDATLLDIGSNVSITRTTIYTHDASTKMFCKNNAVKVANVVIGNNVFIGAHCVILPNTYIGNNVVIGAGSIVTGVIENDSVYAGNPAKKIMSLNRFIEKNESKMAEDNLLRIDRSKMSKQECANLRELLNGKEAFIVH